VTFGTVKYAVPLAACSEGEVLVLAATYSGTGLVGIVAGVVARTTEVGCGTQLVVSRCSRSRCCRERCRSGSRGTGVKIEDALMDHPPATFSSQPWEPRRSRAARVRRS